MHALSAVVAAAIAEDVSETLGSVCGAMAVTIEDADAGSADESPVFDEPGTASVGAWRRARVTALFADEVAAQVSAVAISSFGGGIETTRIEPVDDHDWVRLSQSQFGPIEVASGLWVVPTWCATPPDARRVIRLDPGLAFGTGSHPTTRMCLAWITARDAARWPRVLDYGCGSGILAIAARLLGAGHVDAVDIDPAAIESTARNAAANGQRHGVHAGPVESAHGRYALVVANILAAPLRDLAPALALHLAPGGELVLSGILERQADDVCAAYARYLPLQVADADDGWVLLAGRATARSAEAGPGLGCVA